MVALVEAGLLAAVLWPVVMFAPWTADPYSPIKLVGLALGTAVAWAGLQRGAPRTSLDRPLAAAALVAASSSALSTDRLLSLFGQPHSYAEGLLGQGLCALLLLAAAAAPAASRSRLTRAMAASGALVGAVAVLQYAGFDPLPGGLPPRAWGIRPTSFHGSPVYAGAVLAVSLPPALAATIESQGFRRRLWAAVFFLTAAGTVATLSRGAILAAAVGAGMVLIVREGLTPRAKKAAVSVLFSALIALVYTTLRRPTWRADLQRTAAWGVAFKAVSAHPLLGGGPDTYGLTFRAMRNARVVGLLGDDVAHDNAHNDVLQAAATKGLPGLATLLWLWGTVALHVRRRIGDPSRSSEAAAAAGALAALFVQSKFDPTPLAALAAAALQAGFLCAEETPVSRPRGALGILAAAAGLLLAGRIVASERAIRVAGWYAKNGHVEAAASSLDLAARWESGLVARSEQILYLLRVAASPQTPLRDRNLAFQTAATAAEAAVIAHPNDPAAHHMVGTVWLAVRRAGGPDRLERAQAALSEAARLDPWYRPIARARAAVADAREDSAAASSARADLARIEAALAARSAR